MKTWVEKELIPKHLETTFGSHHHSTAEHNYNSCPNPDDIQVMVKRAIAQKCNSHFDQGAVLQLLQEVKEKRQVNFFFHQYTKPDK